MAETAGGAMAGEWGLLRIRVSHWGGQWLHSVRSVLMIYQKQEKDALLEFREWSGIAGFDRLDWHQLSGCDPTSWWQAARDGVGGVAESGASG